MRTPMLVISYRLVHTGLFTLATGDYSRRIRRQIVAEIGDIVSCVDRAYDCLGL